MAQTVVCLQRRRPGFDPRVGKFPWRRKWQPTPVLLPGKSHGWRSLVGYSPWGRKELNTTEQIHFLEVELDLPGSASGKEPGCQCRRHKRCRVNPWVGKIPWRRAWPPTPVFLRGESHGQNRLAGYSPWGHKESDTTVGTSSSRSRMVNKTNKAFTPQCHQSFRKDKSQSHIQM